MGEVKNGNISYYIALYDTEKNEVNIRTNTKKTREYFKELITDTTAVYKLRGHNVEEVHRELEKYIGHEVTLVQHRIREVMPSVMPIEL